jgi:glycosyltransferase involved in cell wall biosynthesis
VIVTLHGSDVRLLDRGRPVDWLARRVLTKAAAVTTVSRFLANDVKSALPGLRTPVTVTPMPLDVDHFAEGRRAAKADPPRILYAGNLVPSKGVDVLVRAFAALRRAGVASRLKVLGEGPAAAELRALAASLGVADSVDWAPFVGQEQMPEEYGASTVTVLASRGRAEGLGLTLVEALLAGSAVVGTQVGGIPEVVRPMETGLIARDGDSDDLAAQIRRLLEDAELRARLTAAGDAIARATFAVPTATRRMLELYESVRAHADAETSRR